MQNEVLVNDIQAISKDNLKLEGKVYNISEFYDSTLVPDMQTYPQKFI